ncbi:DUF4041 domain-containing protein [Halalkalibacter urbisdiaboli]|uniref:DUF4041 domain-containing protein n=1 Tax=Halalkalibacter urbisdiaboli TaxID=1960589 RepID=UPI000B443156|nr:DUF4041 domain-containing protein [Halalkalibacter urbisdiaboli]
MKNREWYLSTSFISVLFALWFLIIPPIIGVIFLSKQRKMFENLQESISSIAKAKEQEIYNSEKRMELLEKELEEKALNQETELMKKEEQHKKYLERITSHREEDLQRRLKQVEEREKKIEHALIEKENRLNELEAEHQEKLQRMTQEREEELQLKEQHIKEMSIEKEKELENMVLIHQERLKMMTKAREDFLVLREKSIEEREKEVDKVSELLQNVEERVARENQKLIILEQKVINLNDELLYQSFGFYETQYDLENSQEYKEFLGLIRQKQKELVKEEGAAEHHIEWTAGRDKTKKSLMNKNMKLAIRSFNNECDVIISKVKFNTVEVCEKRIRSAFNHINSLNKHNSFELTEEYLDLKLEELFLAYEYARKKQEEKEEQRRINELIREERKAQKELEDELSKLKKEQQHYENALSKTKSEEDALKYRIRLNEIQNQMETVDYRIKNEKAGYVYVISNLGCFGEDVYKIGMTRRLEPMDRVRELGGASVPFRFDVHAIIFSDNAPKMEAELHRAFHHRRVNKINERKEFFKVTLADIKKVVHEKHNAAIEFTMLAEAQEYRETLQLEKKVAKQHIV